MVILCTHNVPKNYKLKCQLTKHINYIFYAMISVSTLTIPTPDLNLINPF
jgi:hypothetical protein